MVHEGMDVTLPIVVPMEWLGDTPVVMLTDYTIPAVGTFTARVFFYGTRYAGTWQHGDGGGRAPVRQDRKIVDRRSIDRQIDRFDHQLTSSPHHEMR